MHLPAAYKRLGLIWEISRINLKAAAQTAVAFKFRDGGWGTPSVTERSPAISQLVYLFAVQEN